MKKTIAVLGSAAALSFAGAGLAAAQTEAPELDTGSLGSSETETVDALADDVETPAEVSEIAKQLCGTISAYDFLGSAGAVVPGLSGDECEANADSAVAAAMSGDIAGALDILRGIEAGTPGEDDDAVDTGSLGSLGGLSSDADTDTGGGTDTETGSGAND